MKTGQLGCQAIRIGGNASASNILRYCPACAEQDRASSGETFWHRLPQIAALRVCPIHRLQFEIPDVANWSVMRRNFFLAEDLAARSARHTKISDFDDWDQFSIWLSQQFAWLLESPKAIFKPEDLTRVYRFHLSDRGYARLGTNRIVDFLKAIENAFPESWLRFLGCAFNSKHAATTWVHEVALRGRGTAVQHCLVLNALGLNIWDLASQASKELMFECGPWPCVNPTCEDYKQNVIDRYVPQFASRNLFFGRFQCKCGYVYRRKGPDPLGKARNEPGLPLETGPVWQHKLHALWFDKRKTIEDIGQQLGVSGHTVV